MSAIHILAERHRREEWPDLPWRIVMLGPKYIESDGTVRELNHVGWAMTCRPSIAPGWDGRLPVIHLETGTMFLSEEVR